MGYIVINKDEDGMRREMRRSMRIGYRREGYTPMMRGVEDGDRMYRMGYCHGWEDHEDEMDEPDFRRQRDSRGRYM